MFDERQKAVQRRLSAINLLPTKQDSTLVTMVEQEQAFEERIVSAYQKVASYQVKQSYERRIILADVSIAVLSSLMMAICLWESKMFNKTLDPSEPFNWQLRLCAMLTGVLIASILVYRSQQKHKLRCSQGQALQTQIDTRTLLTLVAEVLLSLACPIPGYDLVFNIGKRVYDLDKLLSALGLFKIIFILRLIPHFTSTNSQLSSMIFELAGITLSPGLYLRIQLKERPLIILSAFFILTTIVFGFAIQLFERGLQTESAKQQGSLDLFTNVFNSMWCVILAMTTVGYGDIVPITQIGRLYTIAACFAGSFILMLLTCTVSTMVEHSEDQSKAFALIEKINQRYYRGAQALKGSITLKVKQGRSIQLQEKLWESIRVFKEQEIQRDQSDEEEASCGELAQRIENIWETKGRQLIMKSKSIKVKDFPVKHSYSAQKLRESSDALMNLVIRATPRVGNNQQLQKIKLQSKTTQESRTNEQRAEETKQALQNALTTLEQAPRPQQKLENAKSVEILKIYRHPEVEKLMGRRKSIQEPELAKPKLLSPRKDSKNREVQLQASYLSSTRQGQQSHESFEALWAHTGLRSKILKEEQKLASSDAKIARRDNSSLPTHRVLQNNRDELKRLRRVNVETPIQKLNPQLGSQLREEQRRETRQYFKLLSI